MSPLCNPFVQQTDFSEPGFKLDWERVVDALGNNSVGRCRVILGNSSQSETLHVLYLTVQRSYLKGIHAE